MSPGRVRPCQRPCCAPAEGSPAAPPTTPQASAHGPPEAFLTAPRAGIGAPAVLRAQDPLGVISLLPSSPLKLAHPAWRLSQSGWTGTPLSRASSPSGSCPPGCTALLPPALPPPGVRQAAPLHTGGREPVTGAPRHPIWAPRLQARVESSRPKPHGPAHCPEPRLPQGTAAWPAPWVPGNGQEAWLSEAGTATGRPCSAEGRTGPPASGHIAGCTTTPLKARPMPSPPPDLWTDAQMPTALLLPVPQPPKGWARSHCPLSTQGLAAQPKSPAERGR